MHQPSTLLSFLKTNNLKAKKSLSQNFLVDGNILQKIITTAKVSSDDVVIEIGPGPGALTEQLLKTEATVIAIEKDTEFAKQLSRLQTPDNRLIIINKDVLDVSFPEILAPILSKEKKAKVVANLPYHLTTPIMTSLLPLQDLFLSLTIMIQKEVAKRCVALPSTKDYSSLTIFIKYHGEAKYAFTVSSQCFFPKPKVDSAILQINLQPKPALSCSEDVFFTCIRTGFGQRRKMLTTSLKKLYPRETLVKALKEINLLETVRPENLSLENFILLTEKLGQEKLNNVNSTK